MNTKQEWSLATAVLATSGSCSGARAAFPRNNPSTVTVFIVMLAWCLQTPEWTCATSVLQCKPCHVGATWAVAGKPRRTLCTRSFAVIQSLRGRSTWCAQTELWKYIVAIRWYGCHRATGSYFSLTLPTAICVLRQCLFSLAMRAPRHARLSWLGESRRLVTNRAQIGQLSETQSPSAVPSTAQAVCDARIFLARWCRGGSVVVVPW